MDDIYKSQSLFNDIDAIIKRYEARALTTGEKFNLFTIMRMETSEDWTHSAIIAELLNSHGSHGQGDKFFRLFLEVVNSKLSQCGEPATAFGIYNLWLKKRIGKINDAFSEGGEIDIYIEDTRTCLIIENKIYAKDQQKQLLRYINYGKGRRSRVLLLYLTLDGRQYPDDIDLDIETRRRIICISYKNEILAWLEQCKKEVGRLRLIQESLSQYIYLIRKLTNQSMNKEMEDDIIKRVISDRNSLSVAFALKEIMKNDVSNIYDPLLKELKNQLSEKAGALGYKTTDEAWGLSTRLKDDSCFQFTAPGIAYNLYVAFAFDNKNCEDFSIGIYTDELKPATDSFRRLQLEFIKRLEPTIGRPDVGTQDKYLYVCYELDDDSLTLWSKRDIWLDIPNGQTANKLMELVKVIFESIKSIDFGLIK